MKPNFALGLTDDGITLWHRSGDGWLRVGAVALDGADLAQPMRALVEKARLLAPDGITTKLVVPGEHLLLTQAHAPGPGANAQANQIRASLAGRTPFPVEELVFDWSGASSDVAVVVTARETLIEAEDFATDNGLNPVCFVAAVPAPGFRGEPFLGLTRRARAMGMTPEAITRDPAVLRETGIARMPAPKPSVPKVDIPATPVPPPAPKNEAPVAPPKPEPIEGPAEPAQVKVTQNTASDATDAAKPTKQAKLADTPKPEQPKVTVARDKTERPVADALPKAEQPKDNPAPTANAADTSAAFRSRRGTTDAPVPEPATEAKQKTTTATPSPRPSAAAEKPDVVKLAQAKLTSSRATIAAQIKSVSDALRKALPQARDKTPDLIETPDATLARLRSAADVTTKPVPAQPKPAAPAAVSEKVLPDTSSALPPPSQLSPIETLRRVQGQTIPSRTTEAERMTVFGARGAAISPDAPRNRALLVAGGSLLVLVAAAIWALYFLARPTDQAELPEPPREAAAILAPIALPEDVAERDTDPTDDLAAIEAALGADDAAEAERPIEDGSDGMVLPGTPSDEASTPAPVTPPDASGGPTPSQSATPDTAEAGIADLAETSRAGQLAEIRSNSVQLPDDLSQPFSAPNPPAPFGTEPLPPVRAAEAAPQEAATTDLALDTDTPLPDAQGPDAEQELDIRVQAGRPPSRPPAKPARFSQPETTEAEQDAALALPPATSDMASAPDVATEAKQASAAATEDSLVIAVMDAGPPVTPPNFAPRADTATALTLSAQPNDARAELEQRLDQAAIPATLGFVAAPPPDALTEESLEIVVIQARPVVVPSRRAGEAPEQPDPPVSVESAALPDANAALPPPGGVLLSALMRPAPRPSDLIRSAPEPEPARDFSRATTQAVAASPRPADKPSRFAQIVQRSLAAVTAQRPRVTTPPASIAAVPPPVPEPVQTASAAVAAMPNLPTATSVAREATQARAINLRQVNLIGVMGTNANRRALVRLSNGRVVTVRVGERLDDGQVTAIGDSELRYNRRGRDVVLRIAS
ncbi:MAG: hypothetical protein ACK4HW_04570 [Roseinatronobacter sp.]